MSVLSVGLSTTHSLAKSPTSYIYLLTNQGVQSDVHCSPTPSSNPRQVSLLDSSLLTTLSKGTPSLALSPGSLGENITTSDLDLTSLPLNTLLHFGDHEGHAVVRLTGVREPRKRVAEWPKGFRERCRKMVGVMGVVERE
ncbi:hypothetical protein LOCC1_G002541, partial [Lachnellula occidentalis]